ncbi:hypothetical protein QQX98_003383 [Neonectria punicea]|uniref:Uncharacterized protein n=1 Tax=Neonectria punicea TaxID=979145 RepID=A0ABR1HFX0_9HYPO
MRLSLTAVTASLLAVAQARITGISVPSTIKPGDTFNVIIESSNYIQTVYDVAIAVGYAAGEGYPGSLINVADSFYLGPEESNQIENFNKTITIPDSVAKGKGVVSASLFSLYGASKGATLSDYNVTVTFGDETSEKYSTSL